MGGEADIAALSEPRQFRRSRGAEQAKALYKTQSFWPLTNPWLNKIIILVDLGYRPPQHTPFCMPSP
jgi:hypothetical protein